MKLPSRVTSWLHENGHGDISSVEPAAGGCINNGARLLTSTGATFFLKQNDTTPDDMFKREVEGLNALDVEGAPRVPTPLLAGDTFLLMEDLDPGPRSDQYWPDFGRQLATLHGQIGPKFGFEHDNYIGSTPQQNPWTEDGHEFFGQHRLLFQARLAQENGLLGTTELSQTENLARRLPDLVPEQPPSLLHGDLWSGNAIADSEGSPALIDPAAYYGWAEAELAMTTLFGRFPGAFYKAYEEVRSLDRGWQERLPLYNLYHLLNHLNLFGRSYLSQVQSILRRYSD
ncbi:MAG: fructosamine kinase family protein [Anaerolineales bacterium]|nr:fructosamine kinase family protein [Anaerolineales bacterium]